MKTVKAIALVALVALSLSSNAQTSGWETGVSLSGGASDYIFINVGQDHKDEIQDAKDLIRPKFYYSAGAYGRKFFKESYGVELGIQYTSFAAGSKNETFTDFAGLSEGKFKSVTRHNYVEIPVRFVYKKGIGKFDIGGFAGVSPAFLVQCYNRSVTKYNDGPRNVDKEDYKSFSRAIGVFVDAGAFFRYNITEQLALDARPFFKMGTVPFFKEKSELSDVDALLIAGGLNIATVWKF